MGICSNNKIKKENPTGQVEIKIENENYPYIKDMPECDGEKFKGVGIKKMKGYKCDLPINELNKLREEFWNYKIKKGPSIWISIKQACIMDDVRASNKLKSLGLNTLNGCINHIVDSRNNHYQIPNFCINDPYFEKVISLDDSITDDKRISKLIKFCLFDLYKNIKINLEMLETATGKEIKDIYCKMNNIDIESNFMRLIFGGAEILDNHKLYKHQIKNGFTVQLLVAPKSTLH